MALPDGARLGAPQYLRKSRTSHAISAGATAHLEACPMYGRWALIMASATPYTYLPDKIPNHRKNEAFDDPACPPEWPKVADTVIEAGSRLL
jgi:hypothetical protein